MTRLSRRLSGLRPVLRPALVLARRTGTVAEPVAGLARREEGAVTVDWVVLTSAVVLLGGIIGMALIGPVTDQGDTIATTIESAGSLND
ncbi:hypothetical protein [Frigidibacter oleivorans]|uniref:hypothetical protein n=1 Tax=Frigidibacter oleivorans TaxID=2487129 RepID=UPI000F8CD9EA|nr:hypothetical protein [Frigidibacter oleivorans]